MLEIVQIENSPVKSNCFIVYDKQYSDGCLVIDPGSEDEQKIITVIQNNQLMVDYIFLTHEHFDHIWSVNNIFKTFPQAQLVCNRICGENIQDRKKNSSLFYNQIGFELPAPAIVIDDLISGIQWNNYLITFMNTPGHSLGGICIAINEYLFTGDTLIPNEKTVTKLPGGSYEEIKQTIKELQLLKGRNITIYPGHGTPFPLDDYDLNKML
jgi:glyoxylase-like metal-dependent hydrolase (beta-lactamase superfamily II)